MKLMHILWLSQPQLYLPHGSMPSQGPRKSWEKALWSLQEMFIPNKRGVWAMPSLLPMAVDANSFSSHPFSVIFHKSFELILTTWRITSILLLLFFPKPSLLAAYCKPASPFILSFSSQQRWSMSIFFPPLGSWRLNLRPHLYQVLFITVGGLVLEGTF